MPQISFIMAAHDVEGYVESAIRSALAQEGVTLEVVVADDGSRDRTADVVAGVAERDARVRLLRISGKGGPSAARNAAIAAAGGEWLAVLDADDLIEPERTRRLLDLAQVTQADIVADNVARFEDGTGRALSTLLAGGPEDYAFVVTPEEYLRSNILLGPGQGLGYLKPMFRKAFVDAHRLAYDEAVVIGEDFLLCMRALLHGARYVVTSQPCYLYRVRRGSLSYRLARDQVERLARGFDAAIAEGEADPALADAIRAYRSGLERARAFTGMVEGLKGRVYAKSIRTAAGRPDIWPLIGRYGLQFIANRVTFRNNG